MGLALRRTQRYACVCAAPTYVVILSTSVMELSVLMRHVVPESFYNPGYSLARSDRHLVDHEFDALVRIAAAVF